MQMQISHYEASPAPDRGGGGGGGGGGPVVTSWDVSHSGDFVALARAGGAVSLLSVSPLGSVNHTREE